ncbi:CHAD domain-containing protein [Tabrizicola sp.]|uniref:CHAD domain-containing protein n=1 Tax=Tabrizicola sp. TaxID=2005166 RepID=UPI00286AC8E9|nr:CHAD domain-containing protein [Tabrizicola sp.]
MTVLQTGPIGAAVTCEVAFRAILEQCCEAFEAQLARIHAEDDPSGPHKCRVALRRFLTAVDAFSPLLRRKATHRLRARALRIFRSLGPLRDSDVQIADWPDAPDQARRIKENIRLRDEIRRRLGKRDARQFAAEVRRVLEEGALFRNRKAARRLRRAPLGDFAAGALGAAWERCLSHGPSVLWMSPTERHALRKDLKSMRYLAEFIAPVLPDLVPTALYAALCELQDALGALNDFQLARRLMGKVKPKPPLPPQIAAILAAADTQWGQMARTDQPWGKVAEASTPRVQA